MHQDPPTTDAGCPSVHVEKGCWAVKRRIVGCFFLWELSFPISKVFFKIEVEIKKGLLETFMYDHVDQLEHQILTKIYKNEEMTQCEQVPATGPS